MEELNPKRELFCQYYTQPGDTFGNATQSYAQAYDYKLDELPRDNEIYSVDSEGKKDRILKSSYDRACSVCAIQGGRLLRIPQVVSRIQQLRVEKMTDAFVDSELMKVIAQDEEKTPKVAAIREYNNLSARIVKKIDHTSGGEPIFRNLTDDELARITGGSEKGTSA